MMVTALKTPEAYSLSKFSLPNPLTLENFDVAMRGGRFLLWFLNSSILAIGAVALSLTVSAPAAFAIARMQFRGGHSFLALNTALMVLPPVVMLVPLFLFLANVRLISTYPGAALVYAGLVTPFSIYLLTNFFRSIPHELVESALIDGASSLTILLQIMTPLSAPALVTLVIVNGLWVWNDLLIALVLLPRDELRTLMVGITVFGSRYNNDVPVAMAGMLLASVPMLIAYLLGQRYFIRGLVAGAVKG
ncbi:MAG: carbohydrate ABC transporter permease [Anaerolineae bacterium]|nr:carbohydrate ABC transporter permease [Candidatus Roseilinea sp.]MDW8450164.1 carbohydrate ABC transporter permease [Anaerolineae bacterium]